MIVCAFIFPLRRADLRGVHAAFANLPKPLRVTGSRYYGDGGSIGLEIIDGAGKTNRFAFPIRSDDGRRYSHFVVGVWHLDTNTHEQIALDKKTRAYVCYLVETQAVQNVDDDFVLLYLRGAPRDYVPVLFSSMRKALPFD